MSGWRRVSSGNMKHIVELYLMLLVTGLYVVNGCISEHLHASGLEIARVTSNFRLNLVSPNRTYTYKL